MCNIKISDVKSLIRDAENNNNGCPFSAELELQEKHDFLPVELHPACRYAISILFKKQIRIERFMEKEIDKQIDEAEKIMENEIINNK